MLANPEAGRNDGLKLAQSFSGRVPIRGLNVADRALLQPRFDGEPIAGPIAVGSVCPNADNGVIDHSSIFAIFRELSSGDLPSRLAKHRGRVFSRSGNNGGMEIDESERRRLALLAFYEQHKRGLKSVNQWAIAAGVGEATVRGLLKGNKQKNMRADTYGKLAAGAAKLLGRDVSESELLSSAEPATDIEREFLSLLRRLPENRRRAELKALQARMAAEEEGEPPLPEA